jgi:hypothetical protein
MSTHADDTATRMSPAEEQVRQELDTAYQVDRELRFGTPEYRSFLFVMSGAQFWREAEGLGCIFGFLFLIYLVMRGFQALRRDMDGEEPKP